MQDGSTARPGFAIYDAPSVRLLQRQDPILMQNRPSAQVTVGWLHVNLHPPHWFCRFRGVPLVVASTSRAEQSRISQWISTIRGKNSLIHACMGLRKEGEVRDMRDDDEWRWQWRQADDLQFLMWRVWAGSCWWENEPTTEWGCCAGSIFRSVMALSHHLRLAMPWPTHLLCCYLLAVLAGYHAEVTGRSKAHWRASKLSFSVRHD